MRDKRTGVEYQWPSKEQIDAAQQLGFNIVPRGFVFPRKNTVNPDADIEWEVMFSKAELFISRNLHHPKLRELPINCVCFFIKQKCIVCPLRSAPPPSPTLKYPRL